VVAYSPVAALPSAKYESGWNAINQFIREDYSWSGREPNVFHARRGNRYFDFSGVSGLDFAEDSRTFAVADFDGDGRPDVILKSRLGPQVRVLQNNCAGTNHSIGFSLRGTKSNRDAIGARIQVDRQTKWVEAGSGFLSQHSKQVIFGLGDSDQAAHVKITWPSGSVQEFAGLAAGRVYTILEGSSEIKGVPFRAKRQWASVPTEGDNDVRLHDTWFLDPIPLPEPLKGPGLLVLSAGDGDPPKYQFPIIEVALAKASPERRAHYEIFRRYLFDWRTELVTPLALLLNEDGEVAKIYARPPSPQQYQADLQQMSSGGTLPWLPFEGVYLKQPHRDYFKLGAAFLWSSYPEQALPYLSKELKRDPANPRVLTLIGRIYLDIGQLDKAEQNLREALKVDSNYAEAWSELGGLSEDRNDFAQAMVNYQKALSLKPDMVYTLLNAGQLADKQNDSATAQNFYRRALTLNPQSPEAANGLGLALAKQGRQEQAATLFQQAIAERRDYSDAINNLGVLYLQENKPNDAIAAFQYGVRVAPDDDILYLNLGRIFVQQGQTERAREVMQQLLERKPQSATARHALEELDKRR
jgi:tetratricopeptide (TPR) repeat protein